MKKKLNLMGIWNVMPINDWEWCSWEMMEHFQRLTGFKVRVFRNLQGELSRQSFYKQDVDRLMRHFQGLTKVRQNEFIGILVKEADRWAGEEHRYLKSIKRKNFRSVSNRDLTEIIRQWVDLFPRPTMPIWFAVIFDQWYPRPTQMPIFKKQLGRVRDRIGKLHDRSRKVARRLYWEAGRRRGVPADLVWRATPPEMLALMEGKNKKIPKLSERLRHVVFDSLGSKYRISTGKDAKKLTEQYDPQPKITASRSSTLRGAVASSGIARGRVRVIILDREFSSFKKGEILVTIQTMVHYVPIMKKSAAILTEFGGLTSHAAIVSRELKKPCIVGIPSLTSVLKTGDKVEIDATKGIVRKI
ncbi:hypothetical protein KKG41_04145 [Patescibacteria group bacterium]|nr:hypothetical protein [Patescibacteria group bacterium]MBU1891147.1 hypothetical protein [Patescibacteria group bacterium]